MVPKPASLVEPDSPANPFWLTIVVVAGALLMGAGGIIALVHPAMLVSPSDPISNAVRIYAGYLVARNLPLALLLLIMLTIRARRALSILMILTASIQALDAVMDCTEGRWTLVPGVLVFSIFFFIGAARLTGLPFWSSATWRDADLIEIKATSSQKKSRGHI